MNFETNFYTERGEFTRTVTLLGRQVELRIWPAEFGWRFGDGTRRRTTSAGAAYPNLEITHRYLQTGRVAPSVDDDVRGRVPGRQRAVARRGRDGDDPGHARRAAGGEARPVLVGGLTRSEPDAPVRRGQRSGTGTVLVREDGAPQVAFSA